MWLCAPNWSRIATLEGMTRSPNRFTSVLLSSIGLVLGSAVPLSAQEPEVTPTAKPKITIEKGQELMRAMGSGGGSIAEKRDEIRRNLESDPTVDKEFVGRFLKHFDIEKVDRQIAQLYVDEFSPELTTQCLEFFNGEFGKRWVAINRELAPIRAEKSRQTMKEIGPRIRQGLPPEKRDPRPKSEPGSLEDKLDQVLVATRARDLIELPLREQTKNMRATGLPPQTIDLFNQYVNADTILEQMRGDLLKRVDVKLLDGVLEFHRSKAGKGSMERLLRILPKTQEIGAAAASAAVETALRGGE